MVSRVRHIKVAVGIKRERPRIIELTRRRSSTAKDLERPIRGVENLNAAVAEFADILSTVAVDLYVVGITQFSGPAAGPAVSLEPLPVRRKNLDAMIAGIGHVEAVVGADA